MTNTYRDRRKFPDDERRGLVRRMKAEPARRGSPDTGGREQAVTAGALEVAVERAGASLPLARPKHQKGFMKTSTNTLSKLCYCQSARHARAAVRALEAAGYAARTDASGHIYASNTSDAAFNIANAAIKAVK